MRLPAPTALLLAAALALAGCGGPDNSTPETTIPASAEFNDADVEFATRMIPHHAQALVMVDLTRGRDLDPEFVALTEQVLAAQAPEIELMTDWLEDWDQPVPETSRDHVNAEDRGSGHDAGGASGGDMPGMMGEEELTELADANDAVFEEMWLEMMVKHHQGAIEMAKQEQADGEFPAAVELAAAIVSSQQAEIDRMEQMIDG